MVGGLFGRTSLISPAFVPAGDTMLKYFLSELEVRARGFESRGTIDNGKVALLDEFKRGYRELADASAGRFNEDSAWTEAYRLQRIMALAEPADTILPEIERRLDEARTEGIANEPQLRTQFESVSAKTIDTSTNPPSLLPGGEAALRAVLINILEDLHWHNQRKFYSRPLLKKYGKNIVWVAFGAFAGLILPYAYIYAVYSLSYPASPLPMQKMAWVPLYTAMAAGVFGAAFSRLLYVQVNGAKMSLGEIKEGGGGQAIVARCIVGMCGALFVFFFLQSGIAEGSLFPNFLTLNIVDYPAFNDDEKGKVGTDLRLILPNKSLSLLVVWCFLAGFSERLVPTILSSTETKLIDASNGVKK